MAVFTPIGMVQKGRLLASLGFFFILGACIATFSPSGEKLLRDVLMTTISPFVAPPTDIVIVTITEQTLERFPYRSPLDRGALADLVQRIDKAHPRTIGIDLLFDQPTEAEKDRRLAEVIEAAESPVIVASASHGDDLTDKQLSYLSRFAPSAIRGLAALSHDRVDGVVREEFPGRVVNGNWQPSFASALAQTAGISASQAAEKMVYYRSTGIHPARWTIYPAHAAAFAPPAWFAGKFVLIGVDLPLQDRHATPFAVLNGSVAGALPGVVIHANALARLIKGDKIITPEAVAAFAPFVLATALCIWVAWLRISVLVKPVVIIGAVVLVLILEATAFAKAGILLPMVAPSMLLLGLSGFVAILAWHRDSKERRFVQNAFSQYLSPAVVAELVSKPASLRLGGSERLITCVFTDLEGFTSLGERTEPEVFATVLNEYLEAVCGLFIEHGATIDKLIGDAVIGFFGAPGVQEDQAERALKLTLATVAMSRRFRTDLKSRGHDVGVTRIGVHRGPAVVGNFGGNRFFNYTAMGNTVNTAARLEGANKFLGTVNCISEEVANSSDDYLLRPSGVLCLKGKTEWISAFELLEDGRMNREMVEAYSQAYLLMSARDKTAAAAFASLAIQYPNDGLVAYHLGRLKQGEAGDRIYLEGK
ncbi:adenylate/guanylate cyclase domain-containing protein [Mesorhizobium sp. M0085]|uniref:adenylate/guanylate cyclase domain-containing protein n=1 Tax=Mesorhizobium sp. M0085 TaxID=2956872 RepID=UPI003335C198